MADPSLRNHLYSEAERTVQELLNRGVISQQGYNDIFRILSSERGNAQESSYGQPQPYQQYNQNWNQPVQGIPYNTQVLVVNCYGKPVHRAIYSSCIVHWRYCCTAGFTFHTAGLTFQIRGLANRSSLGPEMVW